MNKTQYMSDSRYASVFLKMELLGITDITTKRQVLNGTITWKLPIKNVWRNGKCIEVGSFTTGYVRNNNSASSNYQLNKRIEAASEYFELENGDYRKYTGKKCVLIPIEIDRLAYLMKYCIKNYFIKNANLVADGSYVPKWKHESMLERHDVDREIGEIQVIVDGTRYKVI
tara:strand:- start:390 stop:902 length:513 start_codon:yes stop_codon:yes gene_type:complete